MPKVLALPAKPAVTTSAALLLRALPGDGGRRTRSVAILVADGVDGRSIAIAIEALEAAGATIHLIAPRLGPVMPARGGPFDATGTLENSPPVLFDGLVSPDGALSPRCPTVNQTRAFSSGLPPTSRAPSSASLLRWASTAITNVKARCWRPECKERAQLLSMSCRITPVAIAART
jgi:hypothetical protein